MSKLIETRKAAMTDANIAYELRVKKAEATLVKA